ncbi:hypothetical protein JXQ70_17445 [bacterium]|nr:hypothetical protein [bacterium]
MFYASSFALINTLLGNVKSGINPQFSQYLKLLSEGHNPVTTLTQLYGPIPEIEQSVWRYVNKM